MKIKKNYDILIIGSGLSSLAFTKTLLQKKKIVHIISPQKRDKEETNMINNHVYKFLPPQMINEKKKVNNYFVINKLKIKKNCKIFGSLEFGGLSNYWALQIDQNYKKDISHLSKKVRDGISRSFSELFLNKKKNNFLSLKNIKDLKFFELFKNDKKMFIDYPILGFFNDKKKNLDFKNLNEEKDKLIPKNFYENYLNKKKIFFHDFSVDKIIKKKGLINVICKKNNEIKVFKTKKLIIGCGTIATTKLIADFLSYKNEIKIKHHPRLFSLYISKNKWKNNLNFQPSIMHLKQKKNPDLFTADFRPGNKTIIEALIKLNWFFKPMKPFLNYFRQNLIFSNIFLNSSYSNLFMKMKKNSWCEIYSKKKDLNNIFKNISKKIFNFFLVQKKILFFKINHFPGFGVDFHYFGTIPIKSKKILSVNENCQLKGHKDIYIIDGSVFDFKKNKYPLGLVMANASRVAKLIK